MNTAYAQDTTGRAPVYYLDENGNIIDPSNPEASFVNSNGNTNQNNTAGDINATTNSVRASSSTGINNNVNSDTRTADQIVRQFGNARPGVSRNGELQLGEGVISSPVFKDMTLVDIIQLFVVYAFIIAGAMSAVFVFWGGVRLISSQGDQKKVTEAWGTIRWAILGIIITIFSFTIVAIVGRFFDLNLVDYLSFEVIQEHIGVIIEKASNSSNNGNGSAFIIQE